MKQEDLVQALAKEAGLKPEAARDQVDELVRRILRKLRQGQPVKLPGLGRLVARKRP